MRVTTVSPEKRRELDQGIGVIADIERGVARISQQIAQRAREGVRINPLALDQSGVAERGLVAWRLAVHERDRAAALLQMHRDRHTYYAAAEHDGIEFHVCFPWRQASAVTATSTSQPGFISSACTQARVGAWPSGIHASHTALNSAKCFGSLNQMLA